MHMYIIYKEFNCTLFKVIEVYFFFIISGRDILFA